VVVGGRLVTGKTIRIFLADGEPSGTESSPTSLRLSESTSWTWLLWPIDQPAPLTDRTLCRSRL